MSCMSEALPYKGTGQKWCSCFTCRVWFTLGGTWGFLTCFFHMGSMEAMCRAVVSGKGWAFCTEGRSPPTAATAVLAATRIQRMAGEHCMTPEHCRMCRLVRGREGWKCPHCQLRAAESLCLVGPELPSQELSPWLWTNPSDFAFSKLGAWSLNCSFKLSCFESTWESLFFSFLFAKLQPFH